VIGQWSPSADRIYNPMARATQAPPNHTGAVGARKGGSPDSTEHRQEHRRAPRQKRLDAVAACDAAGDKPSTRRPRAPRGSLKAAARGHTDADAIGPAATAAPATSGGPAAFAGLRWA